MATGEWGGGKEAWIVWGRLASEFLSFQLLLPAPKTVLSLEPPGVERKAPEISDQAGSQGKKL